MTFLCFLTNRKLLKIKLLRQEVRKRKAELSDEETVAAQILYAGSLADAEYRADWSEALIRCMKTENMTYDNFKIAVEAEFGVSIDGNVPLQEYFEAIGTEVSE